jgi:large subunit ribosomal protein L5
MAGNENSKAPRILEKYKNEICPSLMKEFGYKNVMQLPRIQKVVINIGVGDAKLDIKLMDAAIAELKAITGQQPLLKRAKKSVAGFKVREGMPVGCSVTLRGTRMWEFLDRLISLALPSIKDFQGVSRSGFDGRGNYNLGLREQLIFPEINYDKVIRSRGMNVSIVTTAKTDEEAMALLKGMGVPFNR